MTSAESEASIEATIEERGNGLPDVGDYVPGDGGLYLVVRIVGPIHTGGVGRGNYVHALVALVDWNECDEGDEFLAAVTI